MGDFGGQYTKYDCAVLQCLAKTTSTNCWTNPARVMMVVKLTNGLLAALRTSALRLLSNMSVFVVARGATPLLFEAAAKNSQA